MASILFFSLLRLLSLVHLHILNLPRKSTHCQLHILHQIASLRSLHYLFVEKIVYFDSRHSLMILNLFFKEYHRYLVRSVTSVSSIVVILCRRRQDFRKMQDCWAFYVKRYSGLLSTVTSQQHQ